MRRAVRKYGSCCTTNVEGVAQWIADRVGSVTKTLRYQVKFGKIPGKFSG
jgi:hypothetical protein